MYVHLDGNRDTGYQILHSGFLVFHSRGGHQYQGLEYDYRGQ